MIVRHEAYYTSCNGENKIRALIWFDDENAPKGIVQIAHGVREHIGRYDDFARFLVSNGYAVCGNDHLGHGKSANSVSELGRIKAGDRVNMVRDMNTLHRIMSKRYEGVPYFMFGHSMGSLLVRIYMSEFASALAGAVLCGTGQVPEFIAKMSDPVDALLGLFNGEGGHSEFGDRIYTKLTSKLLGENDDDDLAWLSQSIENREAYRADPLCGFKGTNALDRELAMLAITASKPELIQKLPGGFPILLVSGAKDIVGFFGKAISDLCEEYTFDGMKAGMYLYPGGRHEILNEENNEHVYNDVLEFLNLQI